MNLQMNDNQKRITQKALNIYSEFGRGNFKPFINAASDYIDMSINCRANVDFLIISAQQKLTTSAEHFLENEDNINPLIHSAESAQEKIKQGNLDFTEDELQSISNATEQVARIGIGQIQGRDLMMTFFGPDALSTDHFIDIAENFDIAENYIGASNGIFSPKTPADSKNAWDIHQVVRNHLAWKREPEGSIKTHHDSPMRAGREALPKIEDEQGPSETPKQTRSRKNKPS